MEEIWVDIPGFNGRYKISNKGNIKGLFRKSGFRDIKKGFDGRYESVSLTYGFNKQKTFSVHRLVLLSFIEQSDLYVNHINGIKTDNRLENLEYCTAKYNTYHAIQTGLFNPKAPRKNNSGGKQVIQFDMFGNEINRFPSTRDVERKLGFKHSIISQCALGRRKKSYGYKWCYHENNGFVT